MRRGLVGSYFEARLDLPPELELRPWQDQDLNAAGRLYRADAGLELILTESRRFSRSEAGSLYLIEDSTEGRRLRFKLAQNDAVDFPFLAARLRQNSAAEKLTSLWLDHLFERREVQLV